MRLRRKLFFAFLSIAILAATAPLAAQKDGKAFRPDPASTYPSHQKVAGLKLAAVSYESDKETKPLFGGKVNPNEYGILPVLLVLENTGEETLLLDRMIVRYQTPDRQQLQPMPARELPYVLGVKRPGTGPTYPIPIPLPKKKGNPLAAIEFESRSWAARSLIKGESAYGFFYFETRHQRNAMLYVSGIREGGSGQELFFAEIPIDPATKP